MWLIRAVRPTRTRRARRVFRMRPNDPVDTRPYRERLADARRLEAIGFAVRAEHQARRP